MLVANMLICTSSHWACSVELVTAVYSDLAAKINSDEIVHERILNGKVAIRMFVARSLQTAFKIGHVQLSSLFLLQVHCKPLYSDSSAGSNPMLELFSFPITIESWGTIRTQCIFSHCHTSMGFPWYQLVKNRLLCMYLRSWRHSSQEEEELM